MLSRKRKKALVVLSETLTGYSEVLVRTHRETKPLSLTSRTSHAATETRHFFGDRPSTGSGSDIEDDKQGIWERDPWRPTRVPSSIPTFEGLDVVPKPSSVHEATRIVFPTGREGSSRSLRSSRYLCQDIDRTSIPIFRSHRSVSLLEAIRNAKRWTCSFASSSSRKKRSASIASFGRTDRNVGKE